MWWPPVFTFVLVLSRLTGLFLLAPFYGHPAIPARVRAMLLAALSFLIAGFYLDYRVPQPGGLGEMASLVARETALGAVAGIALLLCFSGVQLAGQIVSHLGGVSFGRDFDPFAGESVTAVSTLLLMVSTAFFLASGADRQVMGALLDWFEAMPPGRVVFSADLADGMLLWLRLAFETAFRVAAPVVAALLLSMVMVGIIGRTLPQINILAVGFGINTTVMLGGLLLGIGAMLWVFGEQETVLWESVVDWMRRLETAGR